jgi:hypothetical protein
LTFSHLIDGLISITLFFVDLYVLITAGVIIFVALLLPDMKYSYKTKNIRGLLLIIGMIMQEIFWSFGLKTGIKFGRLIVKIVIHMNLMGILLAIKYV